MNNKYIELSKGDNGSDNQDWSWLIGIGLGILTFLTIIVVITISINTLADIFSAGLGSYLLVLLAVFITPIIFSLFSGNLHRSKETSPYLTSTDSSPFWEGFWQQIGTSFIFSLSAWLIGKILWYFLRILPYKKGITKMTLPALGAGELTIAAGSMLVAFILLFIAGLSSQLTENMHGKYQIEDTALFAVMVSWFLTFIGFLQLLTAMDLVVSGTIKLLGKPGTALAVILFNLAYWIELGISFTMLMNLLNQMI